MSFSKSDYCQQEPSEPEQSREEDWIVIPDTHEPLIPRELFDQARAIREKRRDKLGIETYRNWQGAKSSFLPTGLVVCANCLHEFVPFY